jgi:hypothetical protein
MATLEELQARLARLEDIEKIKQLQHIYGYYRDYAEWKKVVDLFAEKDASVEVADYGVYRGREGVKRFYIDLLGCGGQKPRPKEILAIVFQLQGVVTVDPSGKSARGRWYGMGMEAIPFTSFCEGALHQTWLHGIYENEYVKEDGKWKIKKLHFNLVFRTPFEAGWMKVPVVGERGQDAKIKPDAPPTAYHPYPSGYHLPFSFKNPVTGQ